MKVLDHYQEQYINMYEYVRFQHKLYIKCEIEPLPQSDIDLFWKLMELSYKHECLKEFHSKEVQCKLIRCPLLFERDDVIIMLDPQPSS